MHPNFLLKVTIFGFNFGGSEVAKPYGHFVNLMVEFSLVDLLGSFLTCKLMVDRDVVHELLLIDDLIRVVHIWSKFAPRMSSWCALGADCLSGDNMKGRIFSD